MMCYEPPPERPWFRLAFTFVVCLVAVGLALVLAQVVVAALDPGGLEGARPPW